MSSQKRDARRADEFGDQQRDEQKNGNQAPNEADTLDDGSTPAIPDELRNQWSGVVAEVDRHIDVFAAYVAEVRERAEVNRGWTGGTDRMRDFVNELGCITDEGTDFKVTHGHDTVWVREICRRWPDVAPHILPRLKRSKFDVFYSDLFGGGANA